VGRGYGISRWGLRKILGSHWGIFFIKFHVQNQCHWQGLKYDPLCVSTVIRVFSLNDIIIVRRLKEKETICGSWQNLTGNHCGDTEELATTWHHPWTKQSVFRRNLQFEHGRTFWRLYCMAFKGTCTTWRNLLSAIMSCVCCHTNKPGVLVLFYISCMMLISFLFSDLSELEFFSLKDVWINSTFNHYIIYWPYYYFH